MVALALCGIAGMGMGMAFLFGGGPPPAPPRPRLPSAPGPTAVDMKYSATLYRALVELDAKTFGVGAPSPAELAAPFPYFDELPARRRLHAAGTVHTAHLAISLIVRREQGAVEGQSFRADHLVLKIENLTSHHLAYRVTTEVRDTARCEAKGVIPHDAIAIGAHETILRTECLLQKTAEIQLTRIEVIEIPALSHFYVSRLMPALVLYDPRTAAGHTIPKGSICPQTFSWRDMREGAARGEIDWRDIIDFYARHNCDEYAFFPGYRYRTDAAAPLPARPAFQPPT
jgi:hypothetical protein